MILWQEAFPGQLCIQSAPLIRRRSTTQEWHKFIHECWRSLTTCGHGKSISSAQVSCRTGETLSSKRTIWTSSRTRIDAPCALTIRRSRTSSFAARIHSRRIALTQLGPFLAYYHDKRLSLAVRGVFRVVSTCIHWGKCQAQQENHHEQQWGHLCWRPD